MRSRLSHVFVASTCLLVLCACGGGSGGSGGTPPPVAPAITQQPAGLTVNAGQSATFSVTATRAITIAPSGMLYLTTQTTNGGAVYAVSSSGTTTLLNAQAGKGDLPGIVMGGDGNLYVSDRNYSTINKLTLSGTVTTAVSSSDLPIGTVPGGLPGKINSPAGLALLSTGTPVSLAVVDSFEHAVLRVDLP